MANEQDIIVRIKAEGTQAFVNGLKKAEGQVEDLGEEVDKTEKKMSSSFKKIGAVIGGAFAVQQLIVFGKALGRLAVDIDATEKKFKTVFGNATSIVETFAKKNAAALGLTTNQYKKAAAAAGDLLVPLGFQREEAAKLSSQLVNLSGALSAWTGGQLDAKQTSDILTKALLGEREQLKTLGINLQEADIKARLLEKGQQKLTGTTLAQAKATATLELILEKSTDAQAAFADDTKTLAEQQLVARANFQELADKIATAVIPAYSRLLEVINNLASTSPAKQLAADLESLSKIELNDTREALLLRQQELEAIKESGDLTFRQAVELTNTIPNALEEILELEQKTTDATASRGIGGAVGTKTLAQRKAEKEAAAALLAEEKRIADEKEAARLAAIGQEGSLARLRDLLKEQVQLLTTSNDDDIFKQAGDNIRDLIDEIDNLEDAIRDAIIGTQDIIEVPAITQAIVGPPGTIDKTGELAVDGVREIRDKINAEKDKENAERLKELQAQAQKERDAAISSSINISRETFDIASAFINAEQQVLQNRFDSGLISEKQFQEERSKLMEKQAKANKANAIFEVGLNTASAITSALRAGPIIGPILAAVIGGLAAAQLAAVLKTPIPKFAKGTRKVGDGYELGEDRTLAWLNRGERVVTADDNKKHWGMLNAIEDGDKDAMMKALAGYGIAVQFDNNNSLLNQLDMPMKTLKEIKEGSKSGIDLNPLLNASDRQRVGLGRKLDRLNDNVTKLGTVLGRRMTKA